MPTTRKKIIKTVYKDENSDEEEGGDFSDSGSEAIISDVSSSEDDIISESSSPEEEYDEEESFNKSKRKSAPKKSKSRNYTRKTNNISGCDALDNLPAFCIKDLTEADKLLPPILNLSESDSSDEESPYTLNRSSFTSHQLTHQDNDSDNEVNSEYRNVWSNIEKVQDDSEEIAKKTFMELEQHKSKVEETKATLQNYTLKVNDQESDVRDLLALGEEVEATSEIRTVNKKPKFKKHKDDSDSDMEDWEEVNDTKSIPQQGIQLVVEFPDAGRRKQKTVDVEMMMKRKINRVKKEYQIYMHKVHVLCWLGHGNYISTVLNDRALMAAALSLVHSKERRPKCKVDIKYIEEMITSYKNSLTLKFDKTEEKFKPKAPPLKNILSDQIKKKIVTSRKYLLFIFVILLRALGLQCRVMFNFVTLPIKPPATELCSLSTKPKDKKGSKSQQQNIKTEESKLADTKTNISVDEKKNTRAKSNNRKAKQNKKNIAQVDGNYDGCSEDEMECNKSYFISEDYENLIQVDGGDDSLTTRKTRSNKRNISKIVENTKDENISPPKKPRKNPTRNSLKQDITCDENVNNDVNKRVKRGRNAIDTKEKDNVSDQPRNDTNNLKELTNITPGKPTEENTSTTKLLRKSSRRTTQQLLTSVNEKKVQVVSRNTQRNLKTSSVSVKLNKPADVENNNFEIIEENVTSLKVTRKSTRQNSSITKISLAENDEIKNEQLNKQTQRRSKAADEKVIPNSNDNSKTKKRSVRELSMLVLDKAEDVSPSKGTSNKVIAPTRNLTRSQKSKIANDKLDEQNGNDQSTDRILTNKASKSTGKESSRKTALVVPDQLKIPQIILTRENYQANTGKNNAKTNSSEIKSRITRNRSQATNSSPKNINTITESVNKLRKSVGKRASSVATKKNISYDPGTPQDSSKISIKEELSESLQSVNDKSLTRNNKRKRIDSTNIPKSGTRKKSVKAQTKQELDEDDDYSPVDPKNHNSDSDDSFKPPTISSKPAKKSRRDRRVLSSSTESGISMKNKIDFWCEVFVEELEQWISIDIVNGKIKSTKEVYASATHPVCYMVGWNNNNNLKDLTRKYVPHFNTETRKLRVDTLWWNKAVQPYLGPKTARDKEEDEYLDKMQLEAPLPTVIGEYKNHPLYVLKRHLLKFEAIYPPDSTVLGFVRGEPVYARECVYTCRSRNIWYKKHAKVVRLGEKAYKLVKAQPRWDKINRRIVTDDPPMEIFGPWQVEDFEPPVAENGIVPRNEYGNVELFKDCMLPRGTVHLKLPGLNRIAKKLNIDCATAITGFDVNHGWVRPVYDGFVVCKEFEDIITEAWVDDQEEQERKELEKTEMRVYGNWKRLIKGLLIRERLKNKYGFNDSPPSLTSKGKAKGSKQVVKKRK